MINRYGFPSDGSVAVLSHLRARLPRIFPDYPTPEPHTHASLRPQALLAINLGKNKASAPDSITDFIAGVKMFGPYADVLVVNVSSPNTPGLRGLQSRGLLEELLVGITKERDALPMEVQTLTRRRPRIVLKIAPDLNDAELKDIAEAVKAASGVDGVIVSNTTIQRPPSLSDRMSIALLPLKHPLTPSSSPESRNRWSLWRTSQTPHSPGPADTPFVPPRVRPAHWLRRHFLGT